MLRNMKTKKTNSQRQKAFREALKELENEPITIKELKQFLKERKKKNATKNVLNTRSKKRSIQYPIF